MTLFNLAIEGVQSKKLLQGTIIKLGKLDYYYSYSYSYYYCYFVMARFESGMIASGTGLKA